MDTGHRAEELRQWGNYLADKTNLTLDRAALLLAKILQYRSLKIEEHLEILDRMGRELARYVGQKERPTEIISAINAYLFDEVRFRGNTDDYYDPRNSYLNDLLARKKGIPITISVLYMEVARRINFDLQGVGFPGHFLVKHLDGELEIVIDPFNKGRILAYDDCQGLLDQLYGGQVRFEKKFLAPVTREQVLIRMLRNLKDAFLYSFDYGNALLAADMILTINPEMAEEFRDKGFLLYHGKKYSDALSNLTRYLEMHPNASDADHVMFIIRDIRSLFKSDFYM